MEATKGLCQRGIKGSTTDRFLFYSWFSSKSLAEATMGYDADMVGMVKTNAKILCRDNI